MAENLVLRPPKDVEVNETDPVIFLGGPIQGAPDWQSEAIEIIHELDSGVVVASPRKEYRTGEFVYEAQVDWETRYLARAAQNGVILFWLAEQTEETPGRAYGQTSRFELAEWKTKSGYDKSVNMVVGAEQGFGNVRYITRRFSKDQPSFELYPDLASTCFEAVRILSERIIVDTR